MQTIIGIQYSLDFDMRSSMLIQAIAMPAIKKKMLFHGFIYVNHVSNVYSPLGLSMKKAYNTCKANDMIIAEHIEIFLLEMDQSIAGSVA